MSESSPHTSQLLVDRIDDRPGEAAATVAPAEVPSPPAAPSLTVRHEDGRTRPLDVARLALVIGEACAGLGGVDADTVLAETLRNLYDGMHARELAIAPVMAARPLVETEPNYSLVCARLLLDKLRGEALRHLGEGAEQASHAEMSRRYPSYFAAFVAMGVELGQLDPELARFDLDRLGAALVPDRDLNFQFLGLQTLYDRYLLHDDGTRYELPQAFFMRVAMGLALREDDREARAIEFYHLLSSFDFMCSTPTLFNSGTTRPQLSSCFLTTVEDDLESIFHGISNNALLSKYAGGLGNDWTPVRGIGAHIRGTNGRSQGVVPFLKIANDTAVAVNQGGKRKGAVCAYLETWHIDVEEFLDLRKNTGDERRRTHDMNTANWVPDEFLRRVRADGEWTLFSPDEVPDLHDLYGQAFTQRYCAYEAAADRGEIRVFRRVRARDLWRRMLTMLFETGHPWITFKDPCNLRSPQQHAGVVHSSNLCTEITLNTSPDEVAVCNLGSVNLARHVTEDGIDHERLRNTVRTAVRMLDNVIDVNFYTIPEASRSNLRHRPVGLGLMGFQDALFTLRLPMASWEAVEFADRSMEEISYYAIAASCELAAERGRYESFEGSLWSRGILPIDSLEILSAHRGADLEVDRSSTLDWDALRERVREVGMRNSNVMAIAPTATIANICGVGQSIEPLYRNLYVKANMSGDFTVVNPNLVRELKDRGLWDAAMVADLKYFDGVLGPIDRVPEELKALYATAFEIDSRWLVEAAARRQKWIDQAQSLNLYLARPSGRQLDELYQLAWVRGLKTTYYLRSQSATHVEKSTLRGTDGKLNAVSPVLPSAPAACSVTDPDCEACQ
ncbi:ribonucleoside-diphosphate reductase alpha chain [Streptoalloteichus tenebrarius]|uniref:Ribonucleoside-diphosphate reductase n=1 Tax=Streptoalloteichus tenebrarius (strain ATCC 17920 / DSM 40477 / JCM 4838 / CBS 697.72 / NBRC 16177 / NCIMB 11028 / NRRL B-12390 / A12253. 1 / ISP 5477) TaxID=1933 RepID=A0ABT1HSY6_STRSD|nr:ribonucleoside-diphosphate reductase subunit alpha [Streptoalloteichus tenebrarius]MCP2258530.1 ribonucleoside-diphosphate reductase alpha chain [Streptoalloteichus tenebrarius]BFF04104.1 ribonucleoside-diphosphate reductase subunit alpha [Streptoalloteichus tenebrarius]